jgi:hypothetical protein
MDVEGSNNPLIARCIVCKGNVHAQDRYEFWEGGYYCARHSLPLLRERAREYARLLEAESSLPHER